MRNYEVHVTTRPGSTRRILHELVDGKRAGVMEAVPGQRGWLWYRNDDDSGYPYHRLHTSTIESVENIGEDIVITTMNTVYRLTPCAETIAS